MTEKIPNFYFDLIGRIAPGGLVIVFIFRSAVAESLKDPNVSQAVIVTFVGLVCAYIVGYLLETLAGVVVDLPYSKYVHPLLGKLAHRNHPVTVGLGQDRAIDSSVTSKKAAATIWPSQFRDRLWREISNSATWAHTNLLPSEDLWRFHAARRKKEELIMEQLFDIKEMAERVLFRTLLIISAAACALELFPIYGTSELLRVSEVPVFDLRCYMLAAFLLILSTFLKIWVFASRRVNTAQNERCPCGDDKKDTYRKCCGKQPTPARW